MHTNSSEKNLVIIPIRNKTSDNILSLATCYTKISEKSDFIVVISDNSSDEIYSALNRILLMTNIVHLRPQASSNSNANMKVINIQNALKHFSDTSVASVILLDDDVRPTFAQLREISDTIRKNGVCFSRSMIRYENSDIFDLVDTAGIYIVNLLLPFRQVWGNLSFSGSLAGKHFQQGIELASSVYDELTLIRWLQKCGAEGIYRDDIELEMLGSQRTFSNFLEQRLRYAYENIAIFKINMASLSLLPSAAMGTFIFGFQAFIITLMIGFTILILLAATSKYVHGYTGSIFISSCAPLWFIPYFFTPWVANFYRYILGGYPRGNSYIRNAG